MLPQMFSHFSPSIALLLLISTFAQFRSVSAQLDNCKSDIRSFLPWPYNSSSFVCRPVWNSFILRYSKEPNNVVTFVFSAFYTSGWVGMGFSKDGLMVGSSAMVGWINKEGKAHIRQYYLRGQIPSKVKVNEGQLLGTKIPHVVSLNGPNIYLAFQLQFSAPLTRQSLLFAFGAATPHHFHLAEHDDKHSLLFDFSAGMSSGSAYPYQLKRAHGALAIFAWGVLFPIGAIIARYFRQHDPLWYYFHLILQFSGFVFALASLVAGVSLYNKLHAHVAAHRGLGIFVFVLAILQITAFFVRPDKDSKNRRYWNWYHHWVGRLSLFLAAVNIVLGIHLGRAGNGWKGGYGFCLAVILISVIALEALLCIKKRNKRADPPSFQLPPQ